MYEVVTLREVVEMINESLFNALESQKGLAEELN